MTFTCLNTRNCLDTNKTLQYNKNNRTNNQTKNTHTQTHLRRKNDEKKKCATEYNWLGQFY